MDIDAPAWGAAGDLYPVQVTYTNAGRETIELADPFQCTIAHGAVSVATGQTPKPAQQYACTAEGVRTIRLAPGERHQGHESVVIAGFPAGEYRLPAGWLGAGRAYGPPGTPPEGFTEYPLTPPAPELRFDIR